MKSLQPHYQIGDICSSLILNTPLLFFIVNCNKGGYGYRYNTKYYEESLQYMETLTTLYTDIFREPT